MRVNQCVCVNLNVGYVNQPPSRHWLSDWCQASASIGWLQFGMPVYWADYQWVSYWVELCIFSMDIQRSKMERCNVILAR